MIGPKRLLVFQTAFLGDVILTLPMIQTLKRHFPSALIDVVTTPQAAPLLRHPAISSVIVYDKRKSQKGLNGIASISRYLRSQKYDAAIVPHRSFRSAVVVALSGIPVRIGFSTASGKYFYTAIVGYEKNRHEIERNMMLLSPLHIPSDRKELPSLFPSDSDIRAVDKFLFQREILKEHSMVAIAPGSVWNTKRWLAERYAALSLMLARSGQQVFVIGGETDRELGAAIREAAKHKNVHDVTGTLTLLESAELIRRCKVLVTNDSAPLHIGVAMKIPVAAIFGATVPEFGFAPYGENDIVVETKGLRCRPCAIHGGDVCPIGTFECMKAIEAQTVFDTIKRFL
jgi:heptosyltransferase-2